MQKYICGIISAACLLLCTGCFGESSVPYEPTANHTTPPKVQLPARRGTKPAADGSDTDSAGGDEQSEVTEEEAELDRRLDAIYNLKPVPIPEGGWTDETLLPLINIGGKPAQLPFCLSELLYGYALTGDHAAYYTEYADKVFSHELDFFDLQCSVHHAFGDLEFPENTKPHDSALPDGVYDHELELDAEWAVILDDGSQRMTVSVNCITIGSTFAELEQQIGIDDDDRLPDGDFTHFTVRCDTDSIGITFLGTDTVDTILLRERNYEQ